MADTKQLQAGYPEIEPVPAGAKRPLWSVMIPTFNRDALLRKALRSVLAEDPGPDMMQIEVVDNASDKVDVRAIVDEVGGGRVSYFRQETNIGACGNWNTCVRRARGEWLHLLPDDDGVMPGFYQSYGDLIRRHPEAHLVYGRSIVIDDDDQWTNLCPRDAEHYQPSGPVPDVLERMLGGMFMVPSSVVVRRDTYSEIGGFHPSLSYCMDWELFSRIVAQRTALYHHHPLALLRSHAGAETPQAMKSGQALKDALSSVESALSQLEPEKRRRARPAAYRAWSELPQYIRVAQHKCGDHAGAVRFAVALFRMSPSAGNLGRLLVSACRAAGSGVSGLRRGSQPAG